jgi:hypothetical protein
MQIEPSTRAPSKTVQLSVLAFARCHPLAVRTDSCQQFQPVSWNTPVCRNLLSHDQHHLVATKARAGPGDAKLSERRKSRGARFPRGPSCAHDHWTTARHPSAKLFFGASGYLRAGARSGPSRRGYESALPPPLGVLDRSARDLLLLLCSTLSFPHRDLGITAPELRGVTYVPTHR